MGLGEFDASPFKQNDSDVQWYLFIAATFLSNIVFLNMMIAIMGDTFDKITEKRERNALIQQTKLYGDFISFLTVNKDVDKNRFLYIITPLSTDSSQADDNWEGGYNRISDKLKEMEGRQN